MSQLHLCITLFKKIFSLIAKGKYGTLTCTGEFNKLLDPRLETTNQMKKKSVVEKQINKMLQESGLTDIW